MNKFILFNNTTLKHSHTKQLCQRVGQKRVGILKLFVELPMPWGQVGAAWHGENSGGEIFHRQWNVLAGATGLAENEVKWGKINNAHLPSSRNEVEEQFIITNIIMSQGQGRTRTLSVEFKSVYFQHYHGENWIGAWQAWAGCREVVWS